MLHLRRGKVSRSFCISGSLTCSYLNQDHPTATCICHAWKHLFLHACWRLHANFLAVPARLKNDSQQVLFSQGRSSITVIEKVTNVLPSCVTTQPTCGYHASHQACNCADAAKLELHVVFFVFTFFHLLWAFLYVLYKELLCCSYCTSKNYFDIFLRNTFEEQETLFSEMEPIWHGTHAVELEVHGAGST